MIGQYRINNNENTHHGAHGFVGSNLTQLLRHKGHVAFPLSRRDELDLMEINSVRRTFQELATDAIFNCAAHVGSVHYVMKNTATVAHHNSQMVLNLHKAVSEVRPDA